MKKVVEEKIAQHVFTALQQSESPEQEAHVISSLVKVLTQKDELSKGDRIMSALKTMLDEQVGIVKAHVTVQQRLDPEVKAEIKNLLKAKFNAKDIIILEKIDERILGGIKIKVGEEIYDATIKSKLSKLKDKLQ